jgi:hypothetical protein
MKFEDIKAKYNEYFQPKPKSKPKSKLGDELATLTQQNRKSYGNYKYSIIDYKRIGHEASVTFENFLKNGKRYVGDNTSNRCAVYVSDFHPDCTKVYEVYQKYKQKYEQENLELHWESEQNYSAWDHSPCVAYVTWPLKKSEQT